MIRENLLIHCPSKVPVFNEYNVWLISKYDLYLHPTNKMHVYRKYVKLIINKIQTLKSEGSIIVPTWGIRLDGRFFFWQPFFFFFIYSLLSLLDVSSVLVFVFFFTRCDILNVLFFYKNIIIIKQYILKYKQFLFTAEHTGVQSSPELTKSSKSSSKSLLDLLFIFQIQINFLMTVYTIIGYKYFCFWHLFDNKEKLKTLA